MSTEIRKLIDLVEDAQINSYLDRLKIAETQEEFDSIISEAELYEAPGMVDKIKQGAKMAGLGTLAGLSLMGTPDAKADSPVDMDPSNPSAFTQMDVNEPVAKGPNIKYDMVVRHGYAQDDKNGDLKVLRPNLKAEFYPTTKHYQTANAIVNMEFKEYQKEVAKLQDLREKSKKWNEDNNIYGNPMFSKNPFKMPVSKQMDVANQAKYDFLATVDIMSRPDRHEKFGDNYRMIKGIVAPGAGAKTAVENYKVYQDRVKQFQAPDSAGRNVPQ